MLYLHEELKPYFPNEPSLFDEIMALRGEVFRKAPGRLTQRIMLGNKPYFLKQHHGVGVKEIIKNLMTLRLPVISAKNEWEALRKLKTLQISAPDVLGYGERGLNPAQKKSFIFMSALENTVSLEAYCSTWADKPPPFRLKQRLIKYVAEIASRLHAHGINHRDFYICHFLLNPTDVADNNLNLYLIDLHRAQIRRLTPKRWIIKDLSGLYFSSKSLKLTRRDWLRFICAYRSKSLRAIVATEQHFWEQVQERGEQLYRDHL